MTDAQRIIGNYRTVALLGTGSFGRVYQAKHMVLNRTVALKLMQATPLNTEQEYAQFLQEARFLEVLRHRYILPILDGGVYEGMPYIVSEYAPKSSLRARLQHQESNLLPMETALTILSQIGQALHHVHLAGIVHRDLKPENILFNAKDEALLADFGLATVIASASIKSVSNAGTPRYMAPEQFRGHVSCESDQYALGCIAYELFTGRPPFTAPDPIALMFMHVSDPPVPPTQLNPTLPDYIEEAILQALAKQREERHADIRAFITALNLPTDRDAYPAQINLATPSNSTAAEVLNQGDIIANVAQVASTPAQSADLSQPFVEKTGRAYHEIVQPAEPSHTTGELPQQEALILSATSTSNEQNGKALLTPPAGSNPSSEHTEKVTDPEVFAGVSAPPSQRKGKNKRRPLLLVAAAVVLLSALIVGGVVFALPLFNQAASAAVVTLTLKSKLEQNMYTISEVAGTPDTSKQQVGGIRLVSMTTQTYAQTTNATGQGTTPGTSATGTLEIDNFSNSPLTLSAGTVIQNSNPSPNIAVVLDTSVTVPPSQGSPGFVDVSATVVQVGIIGNIPHSNSNGSSSFNYCTNNCTGNIGWEAFNVTAFTGGMDPQTYTAVQQSDIDGAVQSLEQAHTPNAQQVLQGQMQTNEQIIGKPQCKPNVKSDHIAGDQATRVTVSVSFTCTGEVYNQQTAQAMASQLLTTQAATDLGSGYTLVGNIITTATNATLADAKSGMVTVTVNAQGNWVYQLTTAQQQTLLQQMVKKKKADVQALLLKQPGIVAVKIALTGGNGTLFPTDVKNIKIVIQGATASSQ